MKIWKVNLYLNFSFKKSIVNLFYVLCPAIMLAQSIEITGYLKDKMGEDQIVNAIVLLEESGAIVVTNEEGMFKIMTDLKGNHILRIEAEGYKTMRFPVVLTQEHINTGLLRLEKDLIYDMDQHKTILSEAQLSDNEMESDSYSLLTATRDIFLNAAAFDFGPLFFRVRGYDSKENTVLVNGIPMNKPLNGRPEWNNWGGLNNVVKNREFSIGVEPSAYNFGGLQGTSIFSSRPSFLRPGLRLSTSLSNRTYTTRLMGSYTAHSKKIWYSLSASKRFAQEGVIDGTFYDSSSLFGSVEFQLGQNSALWLTAMYSKNSKGIRAAISEETFSLVGAEYNPYWGWHNGHKRSSRKRQIKEPIIMLNFAKNLGKVWFNTALSYQSGYVMRSRIGYYNAPNPDPVYYRNLPSYSINSRIGASFESAQMAKKGFLVDPQYPWDRLYTANNPMLGDKKASYVEYYDVDESTYLRASTICNYISKNGIKVDGTLNYQQAISRNYAKINDLFGAAYHVDIDPFSNTLNDLEGPFKKEEQDVFDYNYELFSKCFDLFAQIRWELNKWHIFSSFKYSWITYHRNGIYRNERYLDSSKGPSKKYQVQAPSVKMGITYALDGRHWLNANAIFFSRAPLLNSIFINPRENNSMVKSLDPEKVMGFDMNYHIRLPSLMGRITAYYTQFQNITDVNFYYVESGLGSDFVQEVLTNQDRLHMGLEVGLKYTFSSEVSSLFSLAYGKHVYSNNPNISINFDTSGEDENTISSTGFKDLGKTALKGYILPTGPQFALSYGLEYRNPKYWWLALKANYFTENYIGVSAIKRTDSYFLDPNTGKVFENINNDVADQLLRQEALEDVYTLNLIGGKSWLLDGKYLSVFLSINNLFDRTFRSGGYEQSRVGNYQRNLDDSISGNPSFGPKYWYGFGRTYFLNFSISL